MPDRIDERFRWAVEASPSGMILVDQAGTIVLLNSRAESLFGYDREELIGEGIETLIPPRYRALHAGERMRFSEDPQARLMGTGRDFVGLRKDGSEFPAEIGLAPIQEEGPLLTLASIIDITQRKQAEESIRRTNRDLERLLYVISHDLKAPLRSIESFATLLLEDHGADLDDTGLDYLHRVIRASDHMRQLLADLLKLSRARATGDRRKAVPGRALVREVLEVLDGEIQRTGARIDVGESFPTLLVEPTWAMHALENLVANALRFHLEGVPPEIEISGFRRDDEDGVLAGFVVSDRGPGIPEGQAERIFQLFQRGVGHEVPGTGAGLAIAREVAERSGGSCRARNRDGGGAEFTLTFGNQPPTS